MAAFHDRVLARFQETMRATAEQAVKENNAPQGFLEALVAVRSGLAGKLLCGVPP